MQQGTTTQQGKIWVVDDDSSIRWVLDRALSSADFACTCFDSADAMLSALEKELPDVLLSDIRIPGIDGLALLNQLKQSHPLLPVIIMTAHSDLDAAVNAYQSGAFDYLPKPFDIDETVALVERALNHSREQNHTSRDAKPQNQVVSSTMIGEAPAMQEVYRIIGRLSRSSISVLINGESGTGKELVAHALHQHSPRANEPFIALNMAAIPKDLIESELFGHEKGAFTGATQVRQGRFEQANRGSLFLDEIGDMPLDVQTRLLRVLAEGQFYRIGGYTPVKVDVRIIAATHQDLEKRVKENLFREDLFHRLNVIRVQLPPLRERPEDIPRLAHFFLQNTAKELGVESKVLHPDSEKILQRYYWSGNVRQLENVCRWLTVMAASQEILPQDLPNDLLEEHTTENQSLDRQSPEAGQLLSPPQRIIGNELPWFELLGQWTDNALQDGKEDLLAQAIPLLEHTMLNCALKYTNGHKQEAARLLGWGRNTLTRKLKELGIE
ncbi:MAG: nitrogen regulation protein NR(I) [Providencia heimbachae]|nr:nitrogen regulation protein NR(I) [Providencia heimbachae]